MEVRVKAFIISLLLIPIYALLTTLITNSILLLTLSLILVGAAVFLMGFFVSPDARPPNIPSRLHTAKSVLIPLSLITLSQVFYLITGYHSWSYYIESEYILIIGSFLIVWLAGSFSARRLDSHHPQTSKAEIWYEAWKKQHGPKAKTDESILPDEEQPLDE